MMDITQVLDSEWLVNKTCSAVKVFEKNCHAATPEIKLGTECKSVLNTLCIEIPEVYLLKWLQS